MLHDALSIRLSCSDSVRFYWRSKVLHAQAAGYGLVIVYDYHQGGLFKMGGSTDASVEHPAVEIPLVSLGASHLHRASGLPVGARRRGARQREPNGDP